MPSRSIALLCVVFAACVPEAPPPLPDGGPSMEEDAGVKMSREDFCRELAAAGVALSVRCGTLSDAGIEDETNARLSNCTNLPPPRQQFVESAMPACLDFYRSATCATPFNVTPCDDVVVGAVEANGACFANSDCAGGLFCDPTATCPGVCKPRVAIGQPALLHEQCVPEAFVSGGLCQARVAIGGSCATTTSGGPRRVCVKGASCDSSNRCSAFALQGRGEGCDPSYSNCEQGLFCAGGTTGCAPYVGEGGACDSFTARCQPGFVCSQSVCVPAGNTGDACNNNRTCRSSNYCRRVAGMLDGVCSPLIAEHQPCKTIEDRCASGLFCDTAVLGGMDTCERLRGTGGKCTSAQQCNWFFDCKAGSCVALGSFGATCASGADCLSTSCVAGKCTATSFCAEP